MSGFKETSIFAKIALLIAVSDGMFMLTGFASSQWQVGEPGGAYVSYGLWFRCTQPNGTLDCLAFSRVTGQDTSYEGNLRAARGLEFTAFLCLCLCAMLAFVYNYNTRLHHKAAAFFVALMAYMTVATSLGGVIVYGSSLLLPNFSLGWSFATTVIAMILALPVAVFQTIETIKL